MISVWLEVDDDNRDLLIAELWDAGTTGVTELSGSVRAFFDDATNLDELRERFSQYHPVIDVEEERDWITESRERWQPIPVGERFYLVPEWRNDPAPCGRIRLWTFPGMACGTGTHPCTQLALEAMERFLPEAGVVLDVGTGTGILAQAAHLLGAEKVVACDISHEATVIARDNFRKSHFQVPLFTGSLRSVRSGSVACVVANLNAATLRQLKDEIARVATAAATVILTGFRDDEAESILPPSFSQTAMLERDGWACVIADSIHHPPRSVAP